MKKWAGTLCAADMAFARKVEAAGLASVSQVVKALERREHAKIAAWKDALKEKA